MLRRVTWRSWAVLAAAIGGYIALGYWLSSNGTAEELLYKWAALRLSQMVLGAL